MSFKTKNDVERMIKELDIEYKNLITVIKGIHPVSDMTGKVDSNNVIIDARDLRLAIDKFSAVLKEAKLLAK